MEWTSNSPEETIELGKRLLSEFPEVEMICLRGPLGSGKTCFTKGIGAALNVKPDTMRSPTFTTLFEYPGDQKLFHCDFYRYETASDVDVNWWMELIETPDSVVVVEWAERIEPHLPEKRLEVEFLDLGGN